MALARCEVCGCPGETKVRYPHSHKQNTVSDNAILCGASACVRQADVWLTDEEQERYRHGVRVFRIHHAREVTVM